MSRNAGQLFQTALPRSHSQEAPAKPMFNFFYTYYSSATYILSKQTHRISRRKATFNVQFPKLTSIRCKMSRVEGHVAKYCRDVTLAMIDLA